MQTEEETETTKTIRRVENECRKGTLRNGNNIKNEKKEEEKRDAHQSRPSDDLSFIEWGNDVQRAETVFQCVAVSACVCECIQSVVSRIEPHRENCIRNAAHTHTLTSCHCSDISILLIRFLWHHIVPWKSGTHSLAQDVKGEEKCRERIDETHSLGLDILFFNLQFAVSNQKSFVDGSVVLPLLLPMHFVFLYSHSTKDKTRDKINRLHVSIVDALYANNSYNRCTTVWPNNNVQLTTTSERETERERKINRISNEKTDGKNTRNCRMQKKRMFCTKWRRKRKSMEMCIY